MNFVDWVERVMSATFKAWQRADANTQFMGVPIQAIVEELGFDADSSLSDFSDSKLSEALHDALRNLRGMGLLESNDRRYYKVTRNARAYGQANLTTTWPTIMSVFLEPDHLVVLTKMAEIGQEVYDDYACVSDMTGEQVFEALGWSWDDNGMAKGYRIARELEDVGMAEQRAFMGGRVDVIPTYMGIARVTRDVETEQGRIVRDLLNEWETTNVDFKRELNLGRDKEKGEFIRDILGLATTKSSGQRYLIIGFSNDTHDFFASVDAGINQDRLENILHAFCEPAPDVMFWKVPWTGGEVELIEVKRDSTKIPYRVKKSIGRIRKGAIYVRHGSHTEPPTDKELQGLIEEGEKARGEQS